jgi:hypothetical protein
MNLYPPNQNASIIDLINLGRAVVTPEELTEFVRTPSIQATNSVLPPTSLASSASLASPTSINTAGIVQWATSVDGSLTDNGKSITTDSLNNIYVTGYYSGSMTLKNAAGNTQENSSITLPTPSELAAFIVKYNSSGIVQWATYVDGSSYDEGYSITTDSLNNIYVTGYYSGSITLKNASGNTQENSSITLPTPSGTAAFIVKYNSSGIVQWATNVSGSSFGQGFSITTDSLNNIYVTGNYSGSMTLKNASGNTQENSSITLPNATGDAAFIVKYNSSGIVQWATNVDGSSYDEGYSITTDSLNNIYVTGYYSGSITLKNASGNTQENSSITLPTPSGTAAFIVKYNSLGIVQWATNVDGSSYDQGFSITTDSLNNIYVTGYYNSSITLKNASGNTQENSSITLPTATWDAAFIVKYNSVGIVQWATNVDGTGTEVGFSITTDSLNNIYVTGYYTGSMTLKNASGNTQENSSITLPTATGYAAFIVKYNSVGIVQWATNIHGLSYDFGNSITTDSLNNVYVTGYYSSSITLKNASGNTQENSSITLPTPSGPAAFIVKYS